MIRTKHQCYIIILLLSLLTRYGFVFGQYDIEVKISPLITAQQFFTSETGKEQVTPQYSYPLEHQFYSMTASDKYLAIREAVYVPKVYGRGDTVKVREVYKIHLLSPFERTAELPTNGNNYIIKGFFTRDNKDYFVYTSEYNGEYGSGIHNMDGSLERLLSCCVWVTCSPGGTYFYQKGGEIGTGIWSDSGNNSFYVGAAGESVAEAVSDSLLLMLDVLSLSLWNINSKTMIWKTDIPHDGYQFSPNSEISFSLEHNIIAISGRNACYCFDFQGNHLWTDKLFESPKRFQMMGVSKYTGEVVIFTVNQGLMMSIYDRTSKLIRSIDTEIDPMIYKGSWYNRLFVYEDYILAHYIDRTTNDSNYYTNIISIKSDKPTAYNLVGFWLLLSSNDSGQALVGFDQSDNSLKAFELK